MLRGERLAGHRLHFADPPTTAGARCGAVEAARTYVCRVCVAPEFFCALCVQCVSKIRNLRKDGGLESSSPFSGILFSTNLKRHCDRVVSKASYRLSTCLGHIGWNPSRIPLRRE